MGGLAESEADLAQLVCAALQVTGQMDGAVTELSSFGGCGSSGGLPGDELVIGCSWSGAEGDPTRMTGSLQDVVNHRRCMHAAEFAFAA